MKLFFINHIEFLKPSIKASYQLITWFINTSLKKFSRTWPRESSKYFLAIRFFYAADIFCDSFKFFTTNPFIFFSLAYYNICSHITGVIYRETSKKNCYFLDILFRIASSILNTEIRMKNNFKAIECESGFETDEPLNSFYVMQM